MHVWVFKQYSNLFLWSLVMYYHGPKKLADFVTGPMNINTLKYQLKINRIFYVYDEFYEKNQWYSTGEWL